MELCRKNGRFPPPCSSSFQKMLMFVPLVLPHVGLDGRWLMIRRKQLATDLCTAARTTFDYERQRNSQKFGVDKEKRVICILIFEEETFLQMKSRFAFLSQCNGCSGRICKMLGNEQTLCPKSNIAEPEARGSISGIHCSISNACISHKWR